MRIEHLVFKVKSKCWKKCECNDLFHNFQYRLGIILKNLTFVFRPELKPIEKEPEVVLKFPDTDSLSPPIIQIDEVSFRYSPDSDYIFQNVNLGANLDSRICIVSSMHYSFTMIPNDMFFYYKY